MIELAPRLTQVRALVEHGWTNVEIARIQGVAVATVKAQVGELLKRLGVSNRTELAGLASGGRNPPEWQPTPELRWSGPRSGRLQQKWRLGNADEWRDVPGR